MPQMTALSLAAAAEELTSAFVADMMVARSTFTQELDRLIKEAIAAKVPADIINAHVVRSAQRCFEAARAMRAST